MPILLDQALTFIILIVNVILLLRLMFLNLFFSFTMTKFFVPEMLLDELVCIKCKGYLSRFPVYISGEGLGGICGRCDNSKDEFIRDEGYECMVRDLSFPCAYKTNGCPENLTPPELEKHERECEFDKFSCIVQACEWKGSFDKLMEHFKKDHADMVLSAPNFNFNFNQPFDKVMILRHNTELYEIKVKFDEKKKILRFSTKAVRAAMKPLINTYNFKLSSNQEVHTLKEYCMSVDDKFQEEDLSKVFDDAKEIAVQILIKHPFKNEEAIKEVSDTLCFIHFQAMKSALQKN